MGSNSGLDCSESATALPVHDVASHVIGRWFRLERNTFAGLTIWTLAIMEDRALEKDLTKTVCGTNE